MKQSEIIESHVCPKGPHTCPRYIRDRNALIPFAARAASKLTDRDDRPAQWAQVFLRQLDIMYDERFRPRRSL